MGLAELRGSARRRARKIRLFGQLGATRHPCKEHCWKCGIVGKKLGIPPQKLRAAQVRPFHSATFRNISVHH